MSIETTALVVPRPPGAVESAPDRQPASAPRDSAVTAARAAELTSRPPAIEVESLEVEFGAVRAVNGVSFELPRGEVLGFLGPNGAGKTTTINVLSTLLRPTRGTARVLGFDVVKNAAEVRRRLGLVTQRSCVDIMLNVYENMYLYAGLHRIPCRERKVKIDELLQLFGLTDKVDEPVHLLSGGLLRRLALARAFLADCEVLFLDEPTAGIDPRARSAYHDFLRELCRQTGLTIFLATHDLAEAERLCTRIAFIKSGKLVTMATPESLRATIQHSVLSVEFETPVTRRDGMEGRSDVAAVRWEGSRRVELDILHDGERTLDLLEQLRTLGAMKSFELRPPSLEDVFLRLSQE